MIFKNNVWQSLRGMLILCVVFQKEFFVELGLSTGQLGIDDSTQVPPG